MLDILRKKSSSIGVKIILGIIVVVFVLYFGTSTLRRDVGHPASVVASVDGFEITEQDVTNFIRLKKENDPMFANITDELLQMIKGSLIEGLIQEQVMLKSARKIGVAVSDAELADAIRKYPAFQKDSKFDLEGYNNFKPIFTQRYGMDFENWMRDNMIRDKLVKNFESTLVITEEEAKKVFEASNTKVKLKEIVVAVKDIPNFTPDAKKLEEIIATKKTDMADLKTPVDDAKLKEEAVNELKEQAITTETKKLSDDLWGRFIKGENLAAEIKTYSLTQKDTEPTAITESDRAFPGITDVDNLAQIFTLSKDKLYPQNPIEGENGFYFFKFISREDPKWSEFETQKVTLTEQIKKEMAMDSFSDWLKNEVEQANIKRYN